MAINRKILKITIKNAFLFLVSISLLSCYNQKRNCAKFKTGKFSSEITLNEEIITSTFERNDSIQIENFKGVIDTFSVRWINDCEYVIKNKKPKNRLEKKAVAIKIVSTTNNSYTFEYSYVGDNNKQKGLAKKTN